MDAHGIAILVLKTHEAKERGVNQDRDASGKFGPKTSTEVIGQSPTSSARETAGMVGCGPATMLQMMANENYQQDKMSQKVLNETVDVAKTFLDGELAKYGSWEEARVYKLIHSLFGNAGNFALAKTKKGVGSTTIKKFLGVGREK